MVRRFIFNFIYKITLFPLAIYLISRLLPGQVQFASTNHLLDVSLLLLIIGLVADEFVLGMYGIYIATMQGAVTITAIIYLSGFLFTDSRITFTGSIVSGVILGLVELLMHSYVRRDQKREKFEI
ncbi:uncharacterized protein DUF2512 [Aneurinibacillus soli]|uniref:Uncharacterized protein n=1 Tax=Aneurinibacillus soli TaxID=1500254 RepID=A0A0U5B5D6_9BACL|nr:DUF2512 family protein [Aneurinibacillus soli]PYE57913.1 uncharacterized protein DUF2512 [Aneurinibacillus soli]BAU26902.1 hypothetical protein CB4_01071 [Aneurinibacillus soli]